MLRTSLSQQPPASGLLGQLKSHSTRLMLNSHCIAVWSSMSTALAVLSKRQQNWFRCRFLFFSERRELIELRKHNINESVDKSVAPSAFFFCGLLRLATAQNNLHHSRWKSEQRALVYRLVVGPWHTIVFNATNSTRKFCIQYLLRISHTTAASCWWPIFYE